MSLRRPFALAAVAVVMAGGIALAAPAAPTASNVHLNPNTAPAAQLQAIPQLNAATVQAILKGRPYASMSAFNAVVSPAVPADQLSAVYTRVFVPLNLNTATNADILLVPGISRRMSHEFEEYRPYTSMDQFNREIGKYVDQAEVARLASYVTLK